MKRLLICMAIMLVASSAFADFNINDELKLTSDGGVSSNSSDSSTISPSDIKAQNNNDQEEIIGAAQQIKLYYLGDPQVGFNTKTKSLTISGDANSGIANNDMKMQTSIALDLSELFESLPEVKRIKYTGYTSVTNRFGESTGRRITYSITAYRAPFERMKKSGLIDHLQLSGFSTVFGGAGDESEASNILYNLSHP